MNMRQFVLMATALRLCAGFADNPPAAVSQDDSTFALDTRAVRPLSLRETPVVAFVCSTSAWGAAVALAEATVTYVRDGGSPVTLGTTAEGEIAWTPTEDGTYVFTHAPGSGLTATFTVEQPTWPAEWPQDAAVDVKVKFDGWKSAYGVTSFTGKEAAFLMNADPDDTVPTLWIESIVVEDGKATLVVVAEETDLETGINGKLYVDASDDLADWKTVEIDLPDGFAEGKAVFEVEFGKFMKAKVGFKVPEKGD